MNYESAVRYLLSLGRELAAPTQAAAAKFNLENITILLERLGRPDRAYPCVHIAGTNGKGSTAAFLEKIYGALRLPHRAEHFAAIWNLRASTSASVFPERKLPTRDSRKCLRAFIR